MVFRKVIRAWKKAKKKALEKALVLLGALGVGGATALATTTPASATELSVNWSEIGGVIEGAGSIMPSIGNLIVAVVPIMLVLMVLGFVTGLFDSILDSIRSGFRFR